MYICNCNKHYLKIIKHFGFDSLHRFEVLDKLEKKNFTLDRLREMDSKEIGHLIHHVRAGGDVKKAAMEIPVVELEATIQVRNGTIRHLFHKHCCSAVECTV